RARSTDDRCRFRNRIHHIALQMSNTNALEDCRINKTRRATCVFPNDPKMRIAFKIILLLAVSLLLSVLALPQELRRSGFLGVVAAPLTDEARKQLESGEAGILVKSVVDGGVSKGCRHKI